MAICSRIGLLLLRRPDLEVYQPDKRHPSPLGSYLPACAAFAALYGKSSVGNTLTDGIDRGTAEFPQAVAVETVDEYFAH